MPCIKFSCFKFSFSSDEDIKKVREKLDEVRTKCRKLQTDLEEVKSKREETLKTLEQIREECRQKVNDYESRLKASEAGNKMLQEELFKKGL